MAEPALYNPNQVPFGIQGGAYLFKHADGSALSDGGIRIVEPGTQFAPKKEGIVIEQPGIAGNAGAIAIAGPPTEGEPAEKQMKATVTIQVPKNDSPMVEISDYFEAPFGNDTARWVVSAWQLNAQSGTHRTQVLDIIRDHKADADVDADK